MDESSSQKPPRRQRYKGTHPRHFQEKYKELNPDKYVDDIRKMKAAGKTPAGTHLPIAVSEILEALKPKPQEVILDATLGYGGHAQVLLERLNPGGVLIGLDQDSIERPKTQMRLEKYICENSLNVELKIGAINFSETKNFLKQLNYPQVDAVLADLGLSSMQMDTPERGFSYKKEAPFDLRMNPSKGDSESEILKTLSIAQIEEILVAHADEPHARQIAERLFKDKPKTTSEVAQTVEKVMDTWSARIREKEGPTPIRRVFQAFRILVNDEFRVLDVFLEHLPEVLKKGGRVAILSFHSGEDRRVKKSFQFFERQGVYSQVSPEIIRPSMEEQGRNSRSKSAKLRWAIKN